MTWSKLTTRERRGSRARCILLTHGPRTEVAVRLTRLVEPYAVVDPDRDIWMPGGLDAPAETRLVDASGFLAAEHCELLKSWWLAVRQRANTPNWDIAAAATIDGEEGLVLIEAKAHDRELKTDGFGADNSANRKKIRLAVEGANRMLNNVEEGWTLTCDSHYQIANRFAWALKLASIGVPVVLAYVGFLNAAEMHDRGEPFATARSWEEAVRTHTKNVVPANAWGEPLLIEGIPMVPLIRSVAVTLPS